MAKIKLFASTSVAGSKVEDEIDTPDNWEEMTEEEREAYLDEAVQAFMSNVVDCGAYVEE